MPYDRLCLSRWWGRPRRARRYDSDREDLRWPRHNNNKRKWLRQWVARMGTKVTSKTEHAWNSGFDCSLAVYRIYNIGWHKSAGNKGVSYRWRWALQEHRSSGVPHSWRLYSPEPAHIIKMPYDQFSSRNLWKHKLCKLWMLAIILFCIFQIP